MSSSVDKRRQLTKDSSAEFSQQPLLAKRLESGEAKSAVDKQKAADDDHLLQRPEGHFKELLFGFLPRNDAFNIIILVALYLLQGVPIGLALGTLPFLLKQKLSYADMAIFSFAAYPYSLKLLWSPIVDSVYSRRVGRRKSWIVPMQLLTGILFYSLRYTLGSVETAVTIDLYKLTGIWFTVILLCATQDIAVDGWALTLLSRENVEFGSTCQTIGINTGYFASFTIFLALNSAEFCNKYLRSVPEATGILSLTGYIHFWSYCYIIFTMLLLFFKSEKNPKREGDNQEQESQLPIHTAYLQIYRILRLPHMLKLVGVLLIAKIGFIANESITALKLLEKGIQKEDLALSVLIDFPFQILFGYFAAKWSSGNRPLKPWLTAWLGRLLFSAIGPLVVYLAPQNGEAVSGSFFFVVIVTTVMSSFMSTVQFVSMGAFFSKIADPLLGGTYITLLNTVSNFGGMWPRFFALEAVDYFTKARCIILDTTNSSPLANSSCVLESEKASCSKAGGECSIEFDGYFLVCGLSVVIGTAVYFLVISSKVLFLEQCSLSSWRLSKKQLR